MDPSAANYDPLATADSNNWCVARRAGCMMPPPHGAAVAGEDGTLCRPCSRSGFFRTQRFRLSCTGNSTARCYYASFICNSTHLQRRVRYRGQVEADVPRADRALFGGQTAALFVVAGGFRKRVAKNVVVPPHDLNQRVPELFR